MALVLLLGALSTIGIERSPVAQWLPLETVRFDGDLDRLREEDLRRALSDHLAGGFLGVDVAAIRHSVERLPWVDTAITRRVWPDTLQITLTEQQPVARWGGVALMNARAQVFQPRELPGLSLPDLTGPPGSAARVLETYRNLQAVLEPLGMSLAAVTLDERRAWTLRLAGGGQIYLGREAPHARLSRLAAAWSLIPEAQTRQLAAADLRYPNGFALRWQDED